MSNIELSLAINENPRSAPVLEGRVRPQGIDLRCSRLHPSELFWRQLGYQEFQVSEMSMSSLLISRSHGDETWVGIPVFTTRHFFHTGVLVREDAGVTTPAELAGKRVGVPEYQQTAALWTRGILQHEFGLDPRSIHWYMERTPERSHGGATGFTPPEGIDLKYIPADTDMGELLASGELDGALHYLANANNLVDRSRTDFSGGGVVRRLFDPLAESARYFEKTGIFPINHCVVVRADVAKRYPWVMLNLYSAFLEAKLLADSESIAGSSAASSAVSAAGLNPYLDTGLIDTGVASRLRTDLYPYGVAANKALLETICAYSHEQCLTSRKLGLEEVFYPPTLEL